jgi:hypothetical protein
MDLSLSIAIGSSVQVGLFVAPFLVLLSYAVAHTAMDLAFNGGLRVLAVSASAHEVSRRFARAPRCTLRTNTPIILPRAVEGGEGSQ